MATKKTRSSSSTKKTTKKKTTAKKTTAKATTRKTGSRKAAGSKASSSRSSGGSRRGGRVAAIVEDGVVSVEREIGGRVLRLETGRMARQADGAIVASYGETTILATAQSAKARADIDFFPLTVDYREKYAAGGRFPGGFFKREGRPTTREILTCRIIDRSIRPLFPDGYRNECQVLSQVLSSDLETESDILAAIGSFAAVAISSIPHERSLGAVRIGMVDDKLVVNPPWSVVTSDDCRLNLTLAAHDDAVVMVEAGAKEVSEEVMLEALELGHRVCREVVELIDELKRKAGREKQEWIPPARDEALDRAIEKKFGKKLRAVPTTKGDKHARAAAQKEVVTEVREAFAADEDWSDREKKQHDGYVADFAKSLIKDGERQTVLKGTRSDGRDSKTIRPITIEVGILPKVHGSVLFTRGETQALCIATLGTSDDTQNRDGIYPEDPQRFMLHYAFPPFSVGEVRRMLGPGRREIGHGQLAERSITPLMPTHEKFPYTCRVTSEILESNGSSSMASVCGGTLALMDAGVPIQQPVAGIAMGLVMEGKKYSILSDILGSEDHCGDMDFKVAGTGRGLTALQMDIKCDGLTREILEQALEQAREGRLHILRTMLKALRKPRTEISPNAPRLITVKVPVDKIGAIIGPGGSHIRGMQAEHSVRIAVDDEGVVTIAGVEAVKAEACAEYIRSMTQEVEVDKVYAGRVTSIKEFGAFIEILPGQEGLCHVSELSNNFIRSVTDEVTIGDEVQVKVIGIDDFGKIRLSRRALMEPGDDDRGPGGGGGRRGRGRDQDGDSDDGGEPIFRRRRSTPQDDEGGADDGDDDRSDQAEAVGARDDGDDGGDRRPRRGRGRRPSGGGRSRRD